MRYSVGDKVVIGKVAIGTWVGDIQEVLDAGNNTLTIAGIKISEDDSECYVMKEIGYEWFDADIDHVATAKLNENQLRFEDLQVGDVVMLADDFWTKFDDDYEWVDGDGVKWSGTDMARLEDAVGIIVSMDDYDETVFVHIIDGVTLVGTPAMLQKVSGSIKPMDMLLNGQDEEPVTEDMVNHPPHYTRGQFETIDVIEDWQLGYHLGNTVKYISRAGFKDDILQDLKKAKWYLDRYVELLEKGAEDVEDVADATEVHWSEQQPF